jgi:hypothetical protein
MIAGSGKGSLNLFSLQPQPFVTGECGGRRTSFMADILYY